MAGDWTEDPQARAWADRVLAETLPMIRDSEVSLSLIPDEAAVGDVKFAVELGLSIMLDKPVILLIVPGRVLPDHLARVADEIVEYDPESPEMGQRLKAAIARATNETTGDGEAR